MKLSEAVKPITYFKSHSAEVLKNLEEKGTSLIITQNGEARAVVMSIHEYESIKEATALLHLVAQGERSIREGRGLSLNDGFAQLWDNIDRLDQEK